jgi:hypothetical protein
VADDADHFIKRADEHLPAVMRPNELKGRFNIPSAARFDDVKRAAAASRV